MEPGQEERKVLKDSNPGQPKGFRPCFCSAYLRPSPPTAFAKSVAKALDRFDLPIPFANWVLRRKILEENISAYLYAPD